MKPNYELIRKYDKPGPRYTSYPPATFFHNGFDMKEYQDHIIRSNEEGDSNISFYFHVPFCPQMCHFCGCNTDRMPVSQMVSRYFDAMLNEFRAVANLLDKSRKVSQVHWGGGTPNSVSLKYIEVLMDEIKKTFTLTEDAEIAMECNPAYLTTDSVDHLYAMGFNRLSIGIQDFNEDVLRIINRRPSKLPAEEIVRYIKVKGIRVNLDFVYGLPGQTVESFSKSIQKAAQIKPQRLVTFSYAHVPWVKSAQKVLEQYSIPDSHQKLELFSSAYDILTQDGYQFIGLDHFAIPDDSLAIASKNKTLHRNFMGYCTRENTGQVYAFGATGISQTENAYIQNIKSTASYTETALQHGFAVEKGYALSSGDKICRMVIEEIMCNNYVDLHSVAERLQITVRELKGKTGFAEEGLKTFMDDQLVGFDGIHLSVSDHGRFFLRNIAMLFDPLLTGKEMNYSKTI